MSSKRQMDAGVLFLLDQRSQRFEVAISCNLTPERVARITFAFDEGVPGWVVSHQEPLLIDDAAQDARVHPAVVEDHVKSVLAVPLIARDRDREQVIGVLNLFSQSNTGAFYSEAISLTPSEYNVLLVLAQHAGQAIDYVTLVKLGLDYDAEPWEAKELIKRHIYTLRQKLEPDPASPHTILNVRAVGYRLANP